MPGGYLRAAAAGLVAGAGGVGVTRAVGRLERATVHRHDAHLPRGVLEARGGRGRDPRHGVPLRAHAVRWGAGVALGLVRGLMARAGARGPLASVVHAALRVGADGAIENAVGIDASPWRRPRGELVADAGRALAYALGTGALADRFVPR